jgi:hypothetical protein
VKSIWTVSVLVAVIFAAGCGSGVEPPVTSFQSRGAPFVPDGPRGSAVVWAVGDGPPGPGATDVARLLGGARPDVVLYLGDVYPNGTSAAFRQSYARAYGSFARLTAPTPGNHDWPFRADGYDPYWSRVRGRAAPPWYSFSAGGWQLLSLNSEVGPTRAQLGWLRSRLRGRGDCRLAFWHRPRFSAGLHGDQSDMQAFWVALRGHARIVVAGHDHDMQRMAPRGGLVEYVSGAGGRSHYALHRSYPGLAFGDDTSWGALRILLRPGNAQLDFISAGGQRLDSSSVSCRA